MEEIKGLNELVAQLQNLKGMKTQQALLAGANELVYQASQPGYVPVKTGNLRSSATAKLRGDGVEARWDADYAYVNEFGSEHMAGKFYVSRAIDEHGNEIVQKVADEIEYEIRRAL